MKGKSKSKGISRGKGQGQGKSKSKKCKKQSAVEGAKKEEKTDARDEEHHHDNENASSDTTSCHEEKGAAKVAPGAEESGVLEMKQPTKVVENPSLSVLVHAVKVVENPSLFVSSTRPPPGPVPRPDIAVKEDPNDCASKVRLPPPPVHSVLPRPLRPELPSPIWIPPTFSAPPHIPFTTPPPPVHAPAPVASRSFAATMCPPRDLVRATKPDGNLNLATPGTPNPEKVIKHPLANKWTLWWFKEDSNIDYTLCQKPVLTVSTVEDFWALFHNVMPASELSNRQDYSLFKEGIKPLWEDPRNRQGGRWLYPIVLGGAKRDRDYGRVDECWRDALLLLIGEDYGDDTMRNMVNGAVINRRVRNQRVDKLSIWMGVAHAPEVLSFGRVFKDAMGMPGLPFKFELHEDTAMKRGSASKSLYSV